MDFDLLWLCLSCHLSAVSSLPLDMGYLFCWFQGPPVDSCSIASCDFGAFAGGVECMSFYFGILNQKSLDDFNDIL